MTRLINIAQVILPVAGGVAALVARVLPGSARPWLATYLVVLGGVMLGWTVALMLASTAEMVGHGAEEEGEGTVDEQIKEAVARRLESMEGRDA